KSVSLNATFGRAPRQRSIASRLLDLPLSQGPTRQLMPSEGVQVSPRMQRKFSISSLRMRATVRRLLRGIRVWLGRGGIQQARLWYRQQPVLAPTPAHRLNRRGAQSLILVVRADLPRRREGVGRWPLISSGSQSRQLADSGETGR